jgi:hypothetical protein
LFFFPGGVAEIAVPFGYMSVNPLSGNATYLGQSFATLGVTPGAYNWTLSNEDTMFITIDNVAAVPEPASMLAWGLATVAGLVFTRLRRKT